MKIAERNGLTLRQFAHKGMILYQVTTKNMRSLYTGRNFSEACSVAGINGHQNYAPGVQQSKPFKKTGKKNTPLMALTL